MDATDDNIPAMTSTHEEIEVDLPQITTDNKTNVDAIQNIKMVVLDGVVMGPQVNDFYIIQ